MQNPTEEKKEDKPPILIFTIMTLTNILINLDHGILPACTKEIQEHYNMTSTQLGLIGSIVYLGIVIFGTLAGHLYQRLNSKLLTLTALIALEITLIFFVLSDVKWVALVLRMLTGGCQVFLLVYYPVWIDKFGQHLKTLWLTLLQICVPVGIFVGYGITAGVIALGYSVHLQLIQYQYSFYIQIILVCLFIITFAFIPKDKLDSRRNEDEGYVESFFHNPPVIKESLIESEIVGPHLQEAILKDQHKKKKFDYFKMMSRLFKSKLYIIGTLTMAVILFVSTGVQFWLPNYFINTRQFDRGLVNIAYAIISITGPTSGCGFGGWVVNKKGGYENPKTIYYVFMFSCLGIGAALVIPFVEPFIFAAVLLWIVLFFGGAMMPGLTGIMMVSVPPYLRPFGNSNGEIIKNIFGYLPAPFMWGWFDSLFPESRAGLKLNMFWGLWAPLLLGFGSYIRRQEIRAKELSEKLIQEEQESESSDADSPKKKKQKNTMGNTSESKESLPINESQTTEEAKKGAEEDIADKTEKQRQEKSTGE